MVGYGWHRSQWVNKTPLKSTFCGIPGVCELSFNRFAKSITKELIFEELGQVTPGDFFQICIFSTVWRFSSWVWVKLSPIYSKRHLQNDSVPFLPLASHFNTL